MMVFEQRLQEYRRQLEQYLQAYYTRFHTEPQKDLFEAMEYSLLAGGKRLRSTLVFEFCRICGEDWHKALPFGAAIEMIHTYSLIHDDLPCMDDDDFRRGKPTNHKVYGEAMAVLAGDALLTDAFCVASTAQLPAEAVLQAIQVLSECAGSLGMVGGQTLDIQSENRLLTEQEVLDIQTRKTGALIRAACAMGAIAGGATEEQFDAACQYAAGLGLAFQIRDDMLDVIGSADQLGKSIGTDQNKNTFVRLYGLEKCEKLVEKYTDYALAALDHYNDTDFLRQLAQSLTARMK
jgi:geranylgeranyl diphosphate synthase type II